MDVPDYSLKLIWSNRGGSNKFGTFHVDNISLTYGGDTVTLEAASVMNE